MNHLRRRILPLLLACALLLLSACGGGDGASSVKTVEVERKTADTVLVDNGTDYAALYLPEDSFELIQEYDDMGAVYYARYGGWRSDVLYTTSVSEFQLDVGIYACDKDKTGAEEVEETARSYEERDGFIDLGSFRYGDWVYREVTFDAAAKDGTAYKSRIFVTTDDTYLVIFQMVEYKGSSSYVSFGDMKELCGQVLASLTVAPGGSK